MPLAVRVVLGSTRFLRWQGSQSRWRVNPQSASTLLGAAQRESRCWVSRLLLGWVRLAQALSGTSIEPDAVSRTVRTFRRLLGTRWAWRDACLVAKGDLDVSAAPAAAHSHLCSVQGPAAGATPATRLLLLRAGRRRLRLLLLDQMGTPIRDGEASPLRRSGSLGAVVLPSLSSRTRAVGISAEDRACSAAGTCPSTPRSC
jgi:hypothetical protein